MARCEPSCERFANVSARSLRPRIRIGQFMTPKPTRTDDDRESWTKYVMPLGSLLVAAVALLFSTVTYFEQAELESRQRAIAREIDERQSAPVLVGGVERRLRGHRIRVVPETGAAFHKLAERLLWDADKLVVPVRNVGAGTAVLPYSRVWFDQDNKQCVGTLSVPTGARVWDWKRSSEPGTTLCCQASPGNSYIGSLPMNTGSRCRRQRQRRSYFGTPMPWDGLPAGPASAIGAGGEAPDGHSTTCGTAC